MATEIKPPSTFVDDKDLDLAFPTEFIPAEVRAVLPEDLHVRRCRFSTAPGLWTDRSFRSGRYLPQTTTEATSKSSQFSLMPQIQVSQRG